MAEQTIYLYEDNGGRLYLEAGSPAVDLTICDLIHEERRITGAQLDERWPGAVRHLATIGHEVDPESTWYLLGEGDDHGGWAEYLSPDHHLDEIPVLLTISQSQPIVTVLDDRDGHDYLIYERLCEDYPEIRWAPGQMILARLEYVETTFGADAPTFREWADRYAASSERFVRAYVTAWEWPDIRDDADTKGVAEWSPEHGVRILGSMGAAARRYLGLTDEEADWGRIANLSDSYPGGIPLVDLRIETIFGRMEDPEGADYTGHLLPDFLADGVELREWATLDGERICITYYFDADVIAEYRESSNPLEEYPWDPDHIVYVTDEDGDCIVGRGLAGFAF